MNKIIRRFLAPILATCAVAFSITAAPVFVPTAVDTSGVLDYYGDQEKFLTPEGVLATLTLVASPQEAQAAAGDAYLYHRTSSRKSTGYVCRDLASDTACSSSSPKRDLYRGHSTSEWGWLDSDAVYNSGGTFSAGSILTSRTGWIKISGCLVRCTIGFEWK